MRYLTRCKLCDGERIEPRYHLYGGTITVFRCADCSLRFVGDDVPQERIDALYGQEELADYFVALGERHEQKFAPRLEELADLVPPGSRVVDVGCGTGEFSAMAADAGFDAVGLDVSEPSIQAARRIRPEIDFRVADVASLARDEPGSVDVVTMWDVIEHVLHPREVVAGCADVLRRGGLVAIGTPNGDSIYDRGGDLAYRSVRPVGRLMLEQRYSLWHLQIWTARTLARLLEDHGFEVVEARKHRELTAKPSLYFRQAGAARVARVAEVADRAIEALWPIRNKLTVYARKR